jgi:dipeptidyl aminopeptidase/acylaminoacyl peptidase
MYRISSQAFKTCIALLVGVVSLSLPTQPVTGAPPSHSRSHVSIDSLLQNVDAWILSDTTRILAYIDSCNARTDSMLSQSRHWATTHKKMEDLLGIDAIGSPQPDNTGRIYFLMRITGEAGALFYVDEPMGWPHQVTPNSWTDRGINISYFRVHPSGKFVIVYTDVHGDENIDLYRFDRDGTYEPLLIDRTVRYANVQLADGDTVYVIANDGEREHILKLDVQTGDTTFVYSESESIDIMDYHDGNLLCRRMYTFNESQLFTIDLRTKKVTEVGGKAHVMDANLTIRGEILSLSSELSSEDEYFKFLLFEPERPHKPRVVYELQSGSDYGLFLRDRDVMVINLNFDGITRLLAFDLNGKTLPVPQVPVGVASLLRSNGVGDIAFTVSSPQFPPTPYIFHLGDTTLTQIGSVATFGFDFSHIDVQVIHYPSTDGMRIPALLYAPRTAKRDGSNPAVVIYHGGPPSQSRPYFSRSRLFAMEMGLVMLFPNVRGSDGYTPAYEAADNLEGRFQALVDSERALDYLVEDGWSSQDRIAIWGGSYGGYVVNWLSVACPEKFACALSDVGSADVDFNNLHSQKSFLKGWEREMGPVGSELTRSLSPIYRATKVAKPILITSGFHDRRVPAADPRRWSWLLGKLGKDVLYYETVETGHGSSRRSQLIHELSLQYTFMLSHILPEPRIKRLNQPRISTDESLATDLTDWTDIMGNTSHGSPRIGRIGFGPRINADKRR